MTISLLVNTGNEKLERSGVAPGSRERETPNPFPQKSHNTARMGERYKGSAQRRWWAPDQK